jgi:2-polyprenyl-3-methyl-5-hydroxy-6-metoxy-1,4-benzoquinol methylase
MSKEQPKERTMEAQEAVEEELTQESVHEEEKDKYEKMWSVDGYRVHSPGEKSLKAFRDIVRPKPGTTVVDFGSGTARASLELAKDGFKVKMLDLTEKSMDQEVREAVQDNLYDISFMEGSLFDISIPVKELSGDFGYCCDVMEHIPPKYIMQTLTNIMMRVKEGCFFFICFMPDSFGAAIGKPLHLTVRPYSWWVEHLNEVGEVIEARDLLENGMFYVKPKGAN